MVLHSGTPEFFSPELEALGVLPYYSYGSPGGGGIRKSSLITAPQMPLREVMVRFTGITLVTRSQLRAMSLAGSTQRCNQRTLPRK
jgi:hypothetical protein